MPRILRLAPLLAVLAFAGCGGSSSTPAQTTTTQTTTTVISPCPPGLATMGCSVRPPRARLSTPLAAAPAGRHFPDVSSWQGCHLDWSRIAAPGGAVKAGELGEDPCFAHNVASLKAAGKVWVPYWFVRNTGCAHEGSEIVATIRAVGGLTSGPVVLDMEVPEANGYAGCLNAAIVKAFGRPAVIYTSPGSWPGGGNAGLPLWVASYGVSNAPCMWRCPVAWQYTDGASVPRTFINGLGFVDVSVDYGLLGMLPPKPQRLICFGPRLFRNGIPARCKPIRGQVGAWSRQALALDAEAKALHARAARTVKAYS